MSSFIQFIKMFISGNTPKGINFRTNLSIILTFSVLIIEIAMYGIYWDSIPNMIKFDYDFSGKPNDICEKTYIWYNVSMKITILCVGKIKEKFYREAVAEYEKRLSRYTKFQIIEVT